MGAKPETTATKAEADVFGSENIRVWTARNRKYTLQGKLIAFRDSTVEIEKKNDPKTVKAHLSKLSPDDISHVAEAVQMRKGSKVLLGMVSSIESCDAVVLKDLDGNLFRVMLAQIAPPKLSQDHHAESLKLLEDMAAGKHCWVEILEDDGIHDPVGELFIDGTNINMELVAKGAAWHDSRSRLEPRYSNAEYVARSLRLGLWLDNSPVEPWNFR